MDVRDLKILAIDDKQDNLTVLKALVDEQLPGARLLTALDGPKGIELALAEDPDVILLDIVMPVMDGFEVCRRLKRDPRLQAVPVIFVTALRSDRESRVKALEVGAEGFLSKPIDGVELIAQIRAMAKIKEANRRQRLATEHLTAMVAERTRELELELAERKRAEKALEESETKMRSILENIGIGVALVSPEMEILELNKRMREWFPAIDLGKRPICYQAFNNPPREGVCDYCPTCKTLQDGLVHEATTQTPLAGGTRNFRIVSSPIITTSGKVWATIEMVEDITEQLLLESQLRQAQKMEAVGRLAGGVAHDFNNMLSVINGYAEMVLADCPADHPQHPRIREILNAGRQSATLVRQLLAFARKQTIAPRVLDLNETVAGMLKILGRLIGENIELAWLPGHDLWSVKMDPAQIDQILANLAVNARDAITDVGRVTMETENVVLDRTYCSGHAGCAPGEYVLLSVSDSGCGMDQTILGRLFEPFFTTKEPGKGTGLGLATVYGIVKQNNGFINVYSEPGQGTTFKIYLPRCAAQEERFVDMVREPDAPKGTGTVLVVEDKAPVLELTRTLLESLGYRVMTADSPSVAVQCVREHPGEIHLLLTDVIMPEMSGRELWEKVQTLQSGIRCLFMSGYTEDIIAHQGVLEEGVHFIQKPFSRNDLAKKIRAVLVQGRQ